MSNSPLVQYTKISPNSNNPRKDKISKITIHHMAGVLSVETCGNIFAPAARQASSNYAVGSDGRIAMYVEECNRSWCSSSPSNDHQAITIEVSNSQNGGEWPVSDYVLSRLIDLCVDICKRNGIEKLIYDGTPNGNLTRHNMFANTSCPGPYLQSKFPYIAAEVNKRLTPEPIQPLKFKKGDRVIFNGILYYNPDGANPGQSRSNLLSTITLDPQPGRFAPYNINNELGWVREQDLQLYVEPVITEEEIFSYNVVKMGKHYITLNKDEILKIYNQGNEIFKYIILSTERYYIKLNKDEVLKIFVLVSK